MQTYTIKNNLIEFTCMDYGAAMISLKFKGREMILSHKDLDEYIHDPSYRGKSVGRYANRIGGARFTLNGKEYILDKNEGENQLHGGTDAFSDRVWQTEAGSDRIKFTVRSSDGENGYPGNVEASVTFTLKNNALHIDFEGETDADTYFAPTIHPYFISDNAKMEINAKKRVEVKNNLIPTGNLLKCEGKYDYSSMKEISGDLDDAFCINNDYAMTYESGGITMEVWTDFPAVQIYSGNPEGVAIEPEFYPDSPNHKNFPDTTLHPGEKFYKYCEYKFY